MMTQLIYDCFTGPQRVNRISLPSTLHMLHSFQETYKYMCIFQHWHLKPFLMEYKDLFIQHSQYHGCWWPGDARSQVISSHGIDLVPMDYSSPSIRTTIHPMKDSPGFTKQFYGIYNIALLPDRTRRGGTKWWGNTWFDYTSISKIPI